MPAIHIQTRTLDDGPHLRALDEENQGDWIKLGQGLAGSEPWQWLDAAMEASPAFADQLEKARTTDARAFFDKDGFDLPSFLRERPFRQARSESASLLSPLPCPPGGPRARI